MKTAELIDRLTENPAPVRGAAGTLAVGIACGAVVSFVAMLVWLGPRPDLASAMGTPGYWLKFFYTLVLAVLVLRTAERLARPGVPARAGWELLPLAAVALAALAQWTSAPPEQHMPLLMGHSHTECPWRIVVLSLPLLLGALWSLRRLAPIRPALAGAAAGLFAGAAGAWIYAFACAESSAVFVAVWYTAGIALTGLLGAIIGRRALRW